MAGNKQALFYYATLVIIGSAFALGAPFGTRAARQEPLHVHMISGVEEYKSAESLPPWAERLEQRYNVHCTLSMGTDYAKELGNLDELREADLLVLFCRRLKLNEAPWRKIRAYLDSNKPILGIRTASHAFDKNMPKFDIKVLGADYQGHYGEQHSVRLRIPGVGRDHPIVDGIEPWARPGKLYKNRDFAASTQVLLKATGDGHTEAVAWTNTAGDRRVFYTSMGLPGDFEDARFIRLLENGVEWTTQTQLTTNQKDAE
jgi:type 1 glutamine amidotransferase